MKRRRAFTKDPLGIALKAAIRRYGFTRAQTKTAIRLVRRMGHPTDIGSGMGWVFLIIAGMYVGIEKDGYAHT